MQISLIIPIYNREKFLPRLFRSLSQISMQGMELILVDDGSTDQSASLAKEFVCSSAHNFFEHAEFLTMPHRGPCAARNKGFEKASGEYVFFFDSDDEINAEFFVDAKPHFGADLICAPTQIISDNGKRQKRQTICPTTPEAHIVGAVLSTQTCLIRKDFAANIAWDESIRRWNDWEYFLRILLQKPRIAWLKNAYHKIYSHSEQITSRSFYQDLKSLNHTLLVAFNDIKQQDVSQRKVLYNALAAKAMLLSAHIYKEGHKELARKNLRYWQQQPSLRAFIRKARPIFWLDCHGMRGAWRLYLWLIEHTITINS